MALRVQENNNMRFVDIYKLQYQILVYNSHVSKVRIIPKKIAIQFAKISNKQDIHVR